MAEKLRGTAKVQARPGGQPSEHEKGYREGVYDTVLAASLWNGRGAHKPMAGQKLSDLMKVESWDNFLRGLQGLPDGRAEPTQTWPPSQRCTDLV